METKALLVLDTWTTSTEFKTDLINTMKSNGLNIITDLEATDIVLTLNYMTSLIYSYYKNYYLSNASKERTLELMSITASGKLNFYASQLKAYKDAYAHDFKSLGGNENSSTHDTNLNRSGKSKQATTPETIAKGSDYIDDYASSEQKYENANIETGSRSYNSTIKGSEQDYWKNIISIPKRLFEDIIGSFSKFFFSSSMELTPCAVLTIEQAIQKLKDEIKALGTTTSTEINSLKSLITITQEQVKNLQTSVDTLVTTGENTDNRVNTLESQTANLQMKADKTNTNLENLTKVTPTDVAIKNNKLGLEHDNTWLTNQNAITLGDNLTYDEATKTLNAKGGEGSISIITLTDSQALEMQSGKITLTQEHFEIIKKQGFIKIQYNGQDIISGTSTYYNVNNGYTLNGLFLDTLVGVRVFSIYIPSDYNYSQLKIIIGNVLGSAELFIDNNRFYIQFDEDFTKSIYVDKINNAPIIHNQTSETKNYIIGDYTAFQEDDHVDYVKILLKKNNVEEYYGGYVPKALNATATPKVLRSVNNDMSWVELPRYYEHDGILRVNGTNIMFKYISQDNESIDDFYTIIDNLIGNFITASGSFELGTDQIAMVFGIDFNTSMLYCNVLDMTTHKVGSDEIEFSEVTIEDYCENVRSINL